MTRCTLHIGTSGWHYKHWVGTFYPPNTPASRMFQFYAKHFDTVELNNSFYKLPTAESFREWRDAAPRNFLFSVKASRFITHNLDVYKRQVCTTAPVYALCETPKAESAAINR